MRAEAEEGLVRARPPRRPREAALVRRGRQPLPGPGPAGLLRRRGPEPRRAEFPGPVRDSEGRGAAGRIRGGCDIRRRAQGREVRAGIRQLRG